MLNSRYKIIVLSFVAFILLALSISLFTKGFKTLSPVLFTNNPLSNQISTRGEIKDKDNLRLEEIAPNIGYIAPDFTFPDSNGESVSLSQFRGKIVFLNIWATWCGPCRVEMPAMEKLYQKFKNEDFVILAVSIDRQGKSIAMPFVKELGITFPILFSPDSAILDIYMVNALPTSYIIDKKGNIVTHVLGGRNWFGPKTIETFEYLIHKT